MLAKYTLTLVLKPPVINLPRMNLHITVFSDLPVCSSFISCYIRFTINVCILYERQKGENRSPRSTLYPTSSFDVHLAVHHPAWCAHHWKKSGGTKDHGGSAHHNRFFDRLLDSRCIFSLTFLNNGQRPRKYFSYFNACNALGRDPILDV